MLKKIALIVGLLAFVTYVQAYDMYWAIKLQKTLYENELNPVGRWLMEVDNGDVSLFMASKLVGTVLALSLASLLCVRNYRLGLIVCCAFALFQGFLLWFLNYGDILLSSGLAR